MALAAKLSGPPAFSASLTEFFRFHRAVRSVRSTVALEPDREDKDCLSRTASSRDHEHTMAQQRPFDEHATDRPMADSAVSPPVQEQQQPDPMLQMSTGGRIRAGGISLVALAVVVIVGFVLYGLNDHPAGNGATSPAPASAPAANSGAPTPTAPQNGPRNSR
jgi:hypothetical protein